MTIDSASIQHMKRIAFDGGFTNDADKAIVVAAMMMAHELSRFSAVMEQILIKIQEEKP